MPKGPVLISGFPSMRNVSKLVAECIVKDLNATPRKVVPSEHLADAPPRIVIEEGIGRLVQYGFYEGKANGTDLVIVTGDSQPSTSDGYFSLAQEILAEAQALGVKRIFTVGSYGVPWEPKEPKVLAVANDRDLLKEVLEKDVKKCEDRGPITGLEAILPALAQARDIPSALLMVETRWEPGTYLLPDPRAARAGVLALGRILGAAFEGRWLQDLPKVAAVQEKEEEPAEKEREEIPGYR
ncbi:MAG: PAC2 family protein [Halobacteria archaeon]